MRKETPLNRNKVKFLFVANYLLLTYYHYMLFTLLPDLFSNDSDVSLVTFFILCAVAVFLSAWFIGKRPFSNPKDFSYKYFDEDGVEYRVNKKGKLKKVK